MSGRMIRIYHRTTQAAAAAIQAHGFRDAMGTYMTDGEHTGVWFADRPLDPNEGASGDALLMTEIPEDQLAAFEWREEGKPYREWLIPAALANEYGVTLASEPE